jgi:hypothetical protein
MAESQTDDTLDPLLRPEKETSDRDAQPSLVRSLGQLRTPLVPHRSGVGVKGRPNIRQLSNQVEPHPDRPYLDYMAYIYIKLPTLTLFVKVEESLRIPNGL